MGRTARTALLLAAAFLFHGCAGDDGSMGSNSPLLASFVSTGDFHSCAVLPDGTVKCWGLNSSGQLGDGTTLDSLVAVQVSGLSPAIRVTSGAAHSCALLSDGTIRCWGANASGQLGNNTTTSSATPVPVSGITGAVSVDAGGSHTCAALSDGTVRCWGSNSFGQLGNGTNSSASAPVQVSGISAAVLVSAGGSHTCAVIADGTVRCWGSNSFGQLGNSSVTNSTTPVSTSGIGIASRVSAGAGHTCASLTNGTVNCWGSNSSGQLGTPWTLVSTVPPVTLTHSTVPAAVSSMTTSAAPVASGLAHSCARLIDNTVRCWGDNSSGQLGTVYTLGFIPPGAGAANTTIVPVAVAGVSNAIELDAGLFHSCALLSNQRVVCWGLNSSGQLGDGTDITQIIPVEVED